MQSKRSSITYYIDHFEMNGKGGEATAERSLHPLRLLAHTTRLQHQPQNQRLLLSRGLLRLSLYTRSES